MTAEDTLTQLLEDPAWDSDGPTAVVRRVLGLPNRDKWTPDVYLRCINRLLQIRLSTLQEYATKTIDQRIEKLPEAQGGHWLWIGGGQQGAGDRPVVTLNGRRTYAQRAVWIAYEGPLTKDSRLERQCLEPRCVRPMHYVKTYRPTKRTPSIPVVSIDHASRGRHCVDCGTYLPGDAGFRRRNVGDLCQFCDRLRREKKKAPGVAVQRVSEGITGALKKPGRQKDEDDGNH